MDNPLDEIIQKINCHSAPCDLETIIGASLADIQSFFALSSSRDAAIIQGLAAKRLPTLYAAIDAHHDVMRRRRREEGATWAKKHTGRSVPVADARLASPADLQTRIASIQHQIEEREAVEHRSHATWEQGRARLRQLNTRLDALLCRGA